MSNNLITVSTALPDFLREIGYIDEGLADGIAIRSPKLSVTTAKEFTITKEGKQQVLEQRTIRCVIVAASNTLTKAWYEKAYAPGSNEAPDCFSNDGKVPAAGCAKPQHSNCASCPKNAFGSHPVTGRGKACGDRKLIVLVWEHDPDTLLTFNAPTMTLSNLAKLNSELKSAGVPLQSVLVELSFDAGVTYPVVKLSAVGFVDKTTVLRLKALADSDEVKQMLREVDYEAPADTGAVVPNNQIAFGKAGTGAADTASVGAVDPAAAQIAELQAQLARLNSAATKAVEPVGPTPEELKAQQEQALREQLAALRQKQEDDQRIAEAQAEKERQAAAQAAKPKTEAELLQEQIAALTAQLNGATTAEPVGLLQSISASAQLPPPTEVKKRTRRSKEQMEADRLAAASGGSSASGGSPAPGELAGSHDDTATTVLTGEVVADAGTDTPAQTGAPDILSLLSKWQK